MPAFTTEPDLRLRLQLTDTALAPADLLQQCIDDAHAHILTRISPEVNQEDPPPLLAQGECFLAGASALQALATRDALVQKQVTIGGQRLEAGERFGALYAAAEAAAQEAWELLAPFLLPPKTSQRLTASDSQPIFPSI